jgi:hypothetical protein
MLLAVEMTEPPLRGASKARTPFVWFVWFVDKMQRFRSLSAVAPFIEPDAIPPLGLAAHARPR